jgi:mycothiol synthase
VIEIENVRTVDAGGRAEVQSLLKVVEAADGHAALNEHAWLDLVDGGRAEYMGYVARDPEHGHVVGYAHLSRNDRHPDQWALEVAVHPEHRGVGVELALAERALDAAHVDGGGHVHFWVFRPTEIHDALAHQLGLQRGRDLLQMRRPLPVDEQPHFPPGTTVRTFALGQDEDAWIEVNNRAFAGHPEQSSWDRATLERREGEAWFDAGGFLLAEDDKGLAGFCWTKVHPGQLGEIYVIGVDPSRQGTGLGKALVLAGLDSLARRGNTTGMLYVDADNTPAVGLYESLGFAVHHLDRAYVIDV